MQQYEKVNVSYIVPRWGNKEQEVVGQEYEVEMTQANFATAKPHKFERWHLDAISGKSYRESELVQFQGNWYRPEHMQDELAEIRKKG